MLAEILKRPANIYINPDFVFKSSHIWPRRAHPSEEVRKGRAVPVGIKAVAARWLSIFSRLHNGRNKKNWGLPLAFPPASLPALSPAHVLSFLPSEKDLHANLTLVTTRETAGRPCGTSLTQSFWVTCVIKWDLAFQKEYCADFSKNYPP